MSVGYLITSHVAYQHAAMPLLLASMEENGVPRKNVVVVVNGSSVQRQFRTNDVLYLFEKPEAASHFIPFVRERLPEKMGIQFWLSLNCTSRCGPRFLELVEAGYDRNADATLAGYLTHLGKRGSEGRAINDCACYSSAYLMSQEAVINENQHFTTFAAVSEQEGLLYALAPRKAHYPNVARQLMEQRDVYGTGVIRLTEYYPAIDLYRYKRNWGQMGEATPTAAL